MLTEFTDWLVTLVKDFFAALWTFLVDLVIGLVDLVLGAIVGILSLIPLPDFLTHGLADVFSNLDPGIVFFINKLGVFTGFAILGGAYVFKLVRKLVTVFQW